MIETNQKKKTSLLKTDQIVKSEIKHLGNADKSLEIPRGKCFKSISYVGKRKIPKNEDSPNGETSLDNGKNGIRNKITSSSFGCMKTKRNFSSNDSDDEFYAIGAVHGLKGNKTPTCRKKKIKKVRFSESTEIIGYSKPIFDISTDSEPSQKKVEDDVLVKFLVENNDGTKTVLNLLDCFDAKSLETYVQLKNHLQDFQKALEPLVADNSLKKFKFSCQKAVTIPVNAISPISAAHLTDKYLKLHNLLSGRSVEVGDVKITASQHPLGVDYCKNLLAKKFVRQGDLTVSSKPDAAFSIATVLASLWIDFPDFGQLVLAHFQAACPYLAPVFLPQVEGQSDENYHKSLGYHYSQSGEVEKQDSFLKRMSGIMRLYSALIISKVRQPGRVNPLGLAEGWRWISALLNLEPRPDICATLLYDFLEVAGNEMFRAYGGQFKKMLAYICQEYFPKLEKVTPSSAGGPLVRLEGFLQKTLKDEFISPPHGVLPHNFW